MAAGLAKTFLFFAAILFLLFIPFFIGAIMFLSRSIKAYKMKKSDRDDFEDAKLFVPTLLMLPFIIAAGLIINLLDGLKGMQF